MTDENNGITAKEFVADFRDLAATALSRLDDYPSFKAEQIRTWKNVRGRRPHLKMFWDDELAEMLLTRFHFAGVSIAGFRFRDA